MTASPNALITTNVTYAGLCLRGYHSPSPFFTFALFSIVHSRTFEFVKSSYFSRSFLRSSLSGPIQFYRSSFSEYLDTVISVSGRITTEAFDGSITPKDFTSQTDAEPQPPYTYVKMLQCSFTAVKHQGRGAFRINSVSTWIYSSNWTECVALAGDGGGVSAVGSSQETLEFRQANFDNCSAEIGAGGAIFTIDYVTVITEKVNFRRCYAGAAQDPGGCIYSRNTLAGRLNVQFCLFQLRPQDMGMRAAAIYSYLKFQFVLEYNHFNDAGENLTTIVISEPNRWEPVENYFLSTRTDMWSPPTPSFTASSQFTPSPNFTASSSFTASPNFTASSEFSPSSEFTMSSSFTPSDELTPPTETFTSSNPFTPTENFTASNPFTASSTFTQSSEFTASLPFTPTNEFTPSASFTPSPTGIPTRTGVAPTPTGGVAVPTASPAPTGTPAATARSIKWSPLGIGMLLLGLAIVIIGLIVNTILLCQMVTSGEIIVTQQL